MDTVHTEHPGRASGAGLGQPVRRKRTENPKPGPQSGRGCATNVCKHVQLGHASLDSQRAEVTNDLGFRGFFGLLDVHPEALGPVPDPLARQVRSQTSPDPGPGHPICTRWCRRRKGVRHSTSAMGRRAKHTFTSLPPSPSQVSLPPSLLAEGDDATPGRKMAARRCVCYNTHSLCTCGRILRRDAQDKQTY